MNEFLFRGKLYYSSVEFALHQIGGTWKIPIIRSLEGKTLRFSEVGKKIPRISNTVLASQLKELNQNGFIDRMVYPAVPPRVEYTLTPKGESSIPIIEVISDYGLFLMKDYNDKIKYIEQVEENTIF